MIIAGNWKMNQSLALAGQLANALTVRSFEPVTRILRTASLFGANLGSAWGK